MSKNDQVAYALYGMSVFGLGEIMGGICHGLLIDKVGSRNSIYAHLIVFIIMLITTEVSLYRL